MAVTYNRHNWNNNGAPAINATNLNGIEQGLVDVIAQSNANKVVTDAVKNINGIVQSNGDGTFTVASGSELLPEVTVADNGKVLKVVNGAWATANGVTVTTSTTSGTTGNTVSITT